MIKEDIDINKLPETPMEKILAYGKKHCEKARCFNLQ
jgi:hypothetical protein